MHMMSGPLKDNIQLIYQITLSGGFKLRAITHRWHLGHIWLKAKGQGFHISNSLLGDCSLEVPYKTHKQAFLQKGVISPQRLNL